MFALLPIWFFLLAGGSCFCFARKSSYDDMIVGLSEGRDGVRVKFRRWDRSADCDLGRGIWYGRWLFLKYCSCGERVTIWWGVCVGCRIWGGKGGGGGCCLCSWEEGPALGCSGHFFFFAAPSPLSLLLFKFTLVYISSGWFILLFFLCFLGDAKSTVTVGVFGVVVEGLGDAASADVADAGVTGGSGVAAAVGGAFFLRGWRWAFFPLFGGPLPLTGHLCPALLVIFRLGLPWASASLLMVGGGLCLLLLTWLTPFLCFQVAGGKTWRYGQFVYTPSTWGVFLLPSFADPRILVSPGWL